MDAQARIREIWSLDSQNHGEGWVLNENTLIRNMDVMSKKNIDPGVNFLLNFFYFLFLFYLAIWDYADAFAVLIKSGLLGIVDPRVNPIVICGHSAGSIAT